MIKKIGNRLILVGVAHVLPQSLKKVEDTIEKESPRVVGLELCQSRYFQLTTSQGKLKERKFEFSRRTILAYFIRYFQEKIGQQTGVMPGEEMLTAARKAQESDAEVALLDRDINLTLRRLGSQMDLWEKLKILAQMILFFLPGQEEIELERVTEKKVVEELLSSFRKTSESAYKVLIEERDEYMTNRILELLNSRDGKILCVVGAGHIPGITKKLKPRLESKNLEPWGSFQLDWENAEI